MQFPVFGIKTPTASCPACVAVTKDQAGVLAVSLYSTGTDAAAALQAMAVPGEVAMLNDHAEVAAFSAHAREHHDCRLVEIDPTADAPGRREVLPS